MNTTVYKIKLKKGDTVMVRSGKYKGREGKITAVHPRLNKITVDGINVVKRHRKPTNLHPQGGIFELTKPIDVSKVGLVEPTTKKPSRVGYKINQAGKKIRFIHATGKEIR